MKPSNIRALTYIFSSIKKIKIKISVELLMKFSSSFCLDNPVSQNSQASRIGLYLSFLGRSRYARWPQRLDGS